MELKKKPRRSAPTRKTPTLSTQRPAAAKSPFNQTVRWLQSCHTTALQQIDGGACRCWEQQSQQLCRQCSKQWQPPQRTRGWKSFTLHRPRAHLLGFSWGHCRSQSSYCPSLPLNGCFIWHQVLFCCCLICLWYVKCGRIRIRHQ